MHMGLASGSDVTATQNARIMLMHAKIAQKRRRINKRYNKHISKRKQTNTCETNKQHSNAQQQQTSNKQTHARVQDEQDADARADGGEELVR